MTHTSKTTTPSGDNFPPIVFFGTDEHSTAVLRTLINAGFSIATVVTKPDAIKGRGKKLLPPAVKQFAHEHNIPVLQPQKVREIITPMQKLGSPVGILVSYGKIIPQSVLDLFTPGIINVHPSLLPRYRGSSPIESAIVNRDSETGVTLMQLVADMDAGPIYMQEEYPLHGNETKPALYDTLFSLGARMLQQALPLIINNALSPFPQNATKATYCQQFQKSDGNLDLTTLSAASAEARIRAYLGFPRTRVMVQNRSLIITKAHITHEAKTPLDLICADGAFLSVDELIAPSGKTMPAGAYLRGYPF